MEAGDVSNDTHEVRIGMNLGYLQNYLYFNGEVDLRNPYASLMAAMWECLEFKTGKDERRLAEWNPGNGGVDNQLSQSRERGKWRR